MQIGVIIPVWVKLSQDPMKGVTLRIALLTFHLQGAMLGGSGSHAGTQIVQEAAILKMEMVPWHS